MSHYTPLFLLCKSVERTGWEKATTWLRISNMVKVEQVAVSEALSVLELKVPVMVLQANHCLYLIG
jgi:hypothetical protein